MCFGDGELVFCLQSIVRTNERPAHAGLSFVDT
jgi:hypothetical protein